MPRPLKPLRRARLRRPPLPSPLRRRRQLCNAQPRYRASPGFTRWLLTTAASRTNSLEVGVNSPALAPSAAQDGRQGSKRRERLTHSGHGRALRAVGVRRKTPHWAAATDSGQRISTHGHVAGPKGATYVPGAVLVGADGFEPPTLAFVSAALSEKGAIRISRDRPQPEHVCSQSVTREEDRDQWLSLRSQPVVRTKCGLSADIIGKAASGKCLLIKEFSGGLNRTLREPRRRNAALSYHRPPRLKATR